MFARPPSRFAAARRRGARPAAWLRAALGAGALGVGLAAGPVATGPDAGRSPLSLSLSLSAARAAPAAAFPREDLAWLASPVDMAAWGGGDAEAIRDLLRKVRDREPGLADDLQAYARARPGDPAAYAVAGLALLGEAAPDNALRSFEKARELGGDPVWLGAAVGAAHALQGRPQAAAKAYDAALALRVDLPLALRGRYLIAVADDDRVAALAWAERLSAALPTEPGELNRAQVDLAELYLRAGRPDDVLALLTPAFLGARIPRPEPLALAAAAPLIQAAQTAGRPGPARRAMAVADRLLPADRRMELPWPVLRARQERMEGRPEQAALMFGDLASGNPALAAAFAPDRARAEIQAGRPAEGLALLRAAWPAIGPSHRAAVLDDYAEAGAAAGWPGDALDWLERRAKDLPSAQGALLSARALLSAERPEGAAARVEELLRDPDAGPQAWLITAAARAWGGGRGLAAATLREGLDLHPRSEALWLALARLETGERRREALTSGAAADPVSAPLRAALAHAQFDLGAPGAAAASFAEAFALAPGSARDRAAASVALVDSGGKLDLALAHARFARAADPDSAWGADALGQALLALGDVDAAEPELRLAVERAGVRDLAAHLHLARLLAARGEAGPASRAALRALGGRLAAHQQTEAESLLRLAESANRVETTLRAMSPQGPGSSLGALILNETEDGLTLDLAAIGLPEGVAMATLAPRPECAAPEIWSAAKSQGAVDLGLGLRLTDPAEALARFAGQGEATEPEEAMPDFLVAAGGIAAVTAKAPSRSIAQMRGRAILLRPEGRPDAPPFACAVIP